MLISVHNTHICEKSQTLNEHKLKRPNFRQIRTQKLTWLDTKIWTGPASAKKPICKPVTNQTKQPHNIPTKSSKRSKLYNQNPTLLTIVTTASRISPLKGLKTTHWYLTGKVTNPVPSLIRPFPMSSTPVMATTNPCRPLFIKKIRLRVLKMGEHLSFIPKLGLGLGFWKGGRERPAGAFDVLHELGDELVAEVGPEMAGVELHVAL